MKKMLILATLAMLLTMGATAQAQIHWGVGVYIGTPPPPPPPRREVVIHRPYADAYWVPGYWSFDRPHRRYCWIGGRWDRPRHEFREERREHRREEWREDRHEGHRDFYSDRRDNDDHEYRGRSRQGR